MRIIDYKKIQLTDSEYKLYQEICKSYTTPKFTGEDLFKDLFETDEKGFIIFLRPPNKTYTSMEAYLFLVTVMIHQHLGHACEFSDKTSKQCQEVVTEAKATIAEMKALMEDFKK